MKRVLNVTAKFKRAAVSRVAAGEAVSSVASDLGIDRRRLYEWQEQVRQGGLEALRGTGRPRQRRVGGPPLRSAIVDGTRLVAAQDRAQPRLRRPVLRRRAMRAKGIVRRLRSGRHCASCG